MATTVQAEEDFSEEVADEYDFIPDTFLAVPKEGKPDKIEVEVGDILQPTFYPQAKIKRWDNETNFSARLVHSETNLVVTTVNEKINWAGSAIEANFYNVEPNDEHPEGAYKFDIILKQRPASNVLQFTIETKGLDFFYQSALTQDEIDEGVTRADNVVGSYAIYHQDNSNNIVGGKSYKSGKAGHIYRPLATDANGITVWGDLNIDTDTGLMTITILPRFLRQATYPVTVA